MASPLAKSTPRPSPRFWGCWDLAAISSGRWGRVTSRRVRGDRYYLLQLEEWLTGVLFQVRPDGRGDHRPDHLWRGRNGCGTGCLWQLCSWSPWQVEKIFSTALISLRLMVALSKRVTPIWLCLRLNIFRFYMMRKAPAIHPAMSEHYNVWASFESDLLINHPMNWDKLSSKCFINTNHVRSARLLVST